MEFPIYKNDLCRDQHWHTANAAIRTIRINMNQLMELFLYSWIFIIIIAWSQSFVKSRLDGKGILMFRSLLFWCHSWINVESWYFCRSCYLKVLYIAYLLWHALPIEHVWEVNEWMYKWVLFCHVRILFTCDVAYELWNCLWACVYTYRFYYQYNPQNKRTSVAEINNKESALFNPH